jgi:hypothetical protein
VRTILSKGFAVLAVLAGVVAIYVLGVRPWFLDWGTTAAERVATLAGDEAVPGVVKTTTRAVTIEAPVEVVWPWVAQLGQDRAGFYSYEILEDVVGAEMPRAETILPGAQEWGPGDRLWMYPPRKLDGLGSAPLVVAVPGRALVFATWRPGPQEPPPDGSWAFVLEPAGGAATRFLVRTRGTAARGRFGRAFDAAAFEPLHFLMERRMLDNVRRLAEGRRPYSPAADVAEVLAWVALVGVLCWGVGAVLRRRRWLAPLAATGAAGLAFQAATLGQPPAFVDWLLVAALVGALVVTRPRTEAAAVAP